MSSLESQKEEAPRRIYFGLNRWVDRVWGQIRSHLRDEAWSASLWQTFFAFCVGANIPVLTELPLTACGCRKFQIDTLVTTSALVPPTRVSRRLTTGWLIKLLISLTQPTKWKHNRWLGSGVSDVGTSSWLGTGSGAFGDGPVHHTWALGK